MKLNNHPPLKISVKELCDALRRADMSPDYEDEAADMLAKWVLDPLRLRYLEVHRKGYLDWGVERAIAKLSPRFLRQMMDATNGLDISVGEDFAVSIKKKDMNTVSFYDVHVGPKHDPTGLLNPYSLLNVELIRIYPTEDPVTNSAATGEWIVRAWNSLRVLFPRASRLFVSRQFPASSAYLNDMQIQAIASLTGVKHLTLQDCIEQGKMHMFSFSNILQGLLTLEIDTAAINMDDAVAISNFGLGRLSLEYIAGMQPHVGLHDFLSLKSMLGTLTNLHISIQGRFMFSDDDLYAISSLQGLEHLKIVSPLTSCSEYFALAFKRLNMISHGFKSVHLEFAEIPLGVARAIGALSSIESLEIACPAFTAQHLFEIGIGVGGSRISHLVLAGMDLSAFNSAFQRFRWFSKLELINCWTKSQNALGSSVELDMRAVPPTTHLVLRNVGWSREFAESLENRPQLSTLVLSVPATSDAEIANIISTNPTITALEVAHGRIGTKAIRAISEHRFLSEIMLRGVRMTYEDLVYLARVFGRITMMYKSLSVYAHSFGLSSEEITALGSYGYWYFNGMVIR